MNNLQPLTLLMIKIIKLHKNKPRLLQMSLINDTHEIIKRKVLKRSKTGLEAEFHVITNKGHISNKGANIVKELQKNNNITITTEVGKNMIEFGCYPDVETLNPMLDLMDSINHTYKLCESKGLTLYPFSTYPGKFTPEMTNKRNYRIKAKIIGKEKFEKTMKVTGFHHHYTLPKGVFDSTTKTLKIMKKSKIARTLISSYNLEIAADPALLLLTQSSPFYDGINMAKNCRALIYRGGKKLNYMDGVYANMQQMGALPPYKQTLTDLMISLDARISRWKKVVKKADKKIKFNKLYQYNLEVGWHPVKINKHGTLEMRGMDLNYMSIIGGITVLMKSILKKIQHEFIEVLPADFAIDEPFKLENGILYIPPQTHVRNNLQKWSVHEGYDNKAMHDYTKRFYKFAKSLVPTRHKRLLNSLGDMVEQGKSISDRILHYAKYKGYMDNNYISNEEAAEIALYFAKKGQQDLHQTQKNFKRISTL